jgi:MFS family permease
MREFHEYCITVFFVSTISDAFRPAVMASISAYSKPENQNRSMSMIRLAINLGFTLGVGVAGIISEYLGFEYLFYIDAITCIIAGLFLRWALVEKEDQTKEVEQKGNISNGSPYGDYPYLAFVIFILLSMIVFSQLWNTIPVYYTNFLDISKDNYGYIMIINGILIVILEMPLVYILEKRYHQLSLVVVGTILITLGFLIFNITDFWQLAIGVSIVAVSLGEIIAFPFSNSYALSRSKPGQRGAYMGMYTMAWSVGGIISPTLGMYIAESYGFPILWYVMTVIGSIAALGFFLLKIKENNAINRATKVELH